MRSPLRTNWGRKSLHTKALAMLAGNWTLATELDQLFHAMEFFGPETWTTLGARLMLLIWTTL